MKRKTLLTRIGCHWHHFVGIEPWLTAPLGPSLLALRMREALGARDRLCPDPNKYVLH